MIDIIMVGIIVICLGAIVYSSIKKAKKGDGIGCGGCSGCSVKSCPSKKE